MEFVDGVMFDLSAMLNEQRQSVLREKVFGLMCVLHSLDIYALGIVALFEEFGYDVEREKRTSAHFVRHFHEYHKSVYAVLPRL